MANSSTTEPSVVPTNETIDPTNGPLGNLYTNEFSPNLLQYPSDLEGSSQKGHIVTFTACVTQPAGYDEDSVFSLKTAENVGNTIESGGGAGLSGVDSVDEKVDLTFQPKRIRSTDVISLYMPDTVSLNYPTSYATVSLKDAISEAASALPGVGKLAKGITSMVDSGVAKLGANMLGYAINPQQQLLFDGIDFRSFQMAFTFTPRNQGESDAVKNIIKTFRLHAAPVIQKGAAAMAFVVPDTFLIQFKKLGIGQNPYILRIKESVLQNIDVNYAPNGIWSTHADGSPTQIQMTLSFKEIALVDRTAISKGF